MKKGGYKIINLDNYSLSDVATVIDGIYETILDNYEKMLLISGMTEGDLIYDDMTGFAIIDDDNIVVTVGTKKLTITPDDEVTISNAGGGGGGDVEIINSLTSDSTTAGLSAKQGKVLKGLVDDKLPLNQGTENVGKYLKVANDGSVEYAEGGGDVEIIDSLTSESTTAGLSAKQGKVLKGLVDNKLPLNQGTENTGKYLKVANDGSVEYAEGGGSATYTAGDGIDITNNIVSVNDSVAKTELISDDWESKTYNVGDYCISDNKLWKCLVQNSERPSEGANWTQTSVGREIKSSSQILLERTSLESRTTYNLSDTIKNYRFVEIRITNPESQKRTGSMMLFVPNIDETATYNLLCMYNTTYYTNVCFTIRDASFITDDIVKTNDDWNVAKIVIYGIK